MAKHYPPTVESIMKECGKEVRKGLGGKRLSKAARTYWVDVYADSIAQALKAGGNWTTDRKRVLPVSRKLGKVAAALTTGGIVLQWAAEAASVAVKSDPTCPGPGSGGYCEVN
jgi:hypothetical protein